MRMFGTYAVLLALCLPGAAMAAQAQPQPQADARWTPLVQSGQGQIFLDRASLERTGDVRTILVRAIPARTFQDMASAEIRMRFDCAARSYAILQMRAFGVDGAELVEVPLAADATASQPVGQEPDTLALFNGVCAL